MLHILKSSGFCLSLSLLALALYSGCASGKSGAKVSKKSDVQVDSPESNFVNYYFISDSNLALEAADTVWQIPEGSQLMDKTCFSLGVCLNNNTDSWVAVPNEESDQGIPQFTAVSRKNPNMRLRVFDFTLAENFTKASDSNEKYPLDSLFSYLFKIKKANNTQFEVKELPKSLLTSSYSSTLDSSAHWYLEIKSATQRHILFLDAKSAKESSLQEKISLQYDSAKVSSSNTEDSKLFNAVLLNTKGLFYVADSNYQQALKYFKIATAANPHNTKFAINNVAMYQALGQAHVGVEFLETRKPMVEKSSQLMGILGSLYEELSQYSEAKHWAEMALQKDPGNVEWLINLSDALWQLGEKVQSRNILYHQYKHRPSFRLSVYLAQTHLGLEEFQNAYRILSEAHKSHKPSQKSMEYFLMALNGLKMYGKVLSNFGEGKKYFKPSARMWVEKATAEFHLKYYILAEYSSKKALDLDPHDDRAKDLATRINTILGTKTNLLIKQPLPSLISARSKQEISDIFHQSLSTGWLESGVPIYMVERKEMMEWEPNSNWHKSTRFLYFVPARNGRSHFKELTFDLNSNHSKMHVNSYLALDTNLEKISSVNSKDFYITKNHNTRVHPENLLIHIPLPEYEGPFFLQVIVTEISAYKSEEFPYSRYTTKNALPFFKNSLEIHTKSKNLNIHHFGKASLSEENYGFRLELAPNGIWGAEKFSPSFEEYGTGYSIAPQKTWSQVGEEYQAYLKQKGINIDSIPFAIKEQAIEVLNNYKDVSSPIHAMYKYVRDEIAYNNFEFGLHALIPENSVDVNIKKYSDCKGHAYLLAQLLRAANIKANLALISLEHEGLPNQPSLHQFNHMIVHVPGPGKNADYFLDPTEKYQPFRQVPVNLQGKNALILDGGNHRLVTLPEIVDSLEHIVEIKHHLTLHKDSKISGLDSIILRGKIAAEFREQISQWEKIGKMETLISWITEGYDGYWNGELSIKQEKEMDKPLVLMFKYKQYLDPVKYQNILNVQPQLEWSFLRYPNSDFRQTPIYFPFEIKVHAEWYYHVAGNETLDTNIRIEKEVEHNLSWQRLPVEKAPNFLHLKQEWTLEPFLAQAHEYKTIKSNWDKLLKKGVFQVKLN